MIAKSNVVGSMTDAPGVRLFSSLTLALFYMSFNLASACSQVDSQEKTGSKPVKAVSRSEAISVGVSQLLKIQDKDGAWPYEGVYRVNREIPVGYRIGGTAICCQALMYAAESGEQEFQEAINRAVDVILTELEDPLMKPSQKDRYDVRVWGHIYALDLFCRIHCCSRFNELSKKTDPWIPILTDWLVSEELETGGWNYANRRAHASFVTAPALQALLWARQSGQKIPDGIWKRSAEALLRSRNDNAAFAYSGDEQKNRPSQLPGSIARSANCEATLSLLGLPRQHAIEQALDAFYEHWNELERRRKKNGTHKPPYGVAPYYFYYGHRYAALAIQQVPNDKHSAESQRLLQMILRTRDSDGTWNDRVFPQSRAYGTAMSVLALLDQAVPAPASLNSINADSTHPELVSIHVNPSLISPRLNVEIAPAGNLKLDDKVLKLEELKTWLVDRPTQHRPNCILISASGETRNRDVENLKSILSDHYGDVSIFVEVRQ